MLTIEQYVGTHGNSPDWDERRKENADNLILRCNALEVEMRADGVEFPINPKTGTGVSGETYGGFRPQDCPIGARYSAHKEGQAVDRYDPKGDIDAWCMSNQDRLDVYGIYIEHPDYTKGWSHWTTRAPMSGRRVFIP